MKPPTYPSRRGGRRRPPRPSADRILFSALFVLVFFSCVAAATTAANPTILKQNLIGNSGSESVPSLAIQDSGGYILLWTDPSASNGADADLVALDKDLKVQGAPKVLGGTGWDYGVCIQNTVNQKPVQTKTGKGWSTITERGLLIAGNSDSPSVAIDGITAKGHSGQDLWMVKLTSGQVQWQKLLGGSTEQLACSVKQTADGGYLVLGSTNGAIPDIDGKALGGGSLLNQDLWLLKLDTDGTCEWHRRLGGNGNEVLGGDQQGQYNAESSLQPTKDGGCILIANSDSNKGNSGDVKTDTNHGKTDIWAVKLDATGTIIWERLLGGAGSESGMSVTRTHDGNYVILGSSDSKSIIPDGTNDVKIEAKSPTSGNDRDVWVVKLGGDGTVIWQTLLGGSGDDQGSSIVEALDGCYVFLGSTKSNVSGSVSGMNHGYTDIWVAKLIPGDGRILWERLIGGAGQDYGHSIRSTGIGIDQHYTIAGTSESSAKGTVPDGDVSEANHYAAGTNPTTDIWVLELEDRSIYYPVDRWTLLIRSWPLLQGLGTLGSGTQTGEGAANGLARLFNGH